MLAPANSTADTMVHSLAYTIASLRSASNKDFDRSDDDRAFFAQERTNLTAVLNDLIAAKQAVDNQMNQAVMLQADVVLGDAVLDRGVRRAKVRLKGALDTATFNASEKIFGANLNEITNAEMRSEPALVTQILDRFSTLPDFADKDQIFNDLNKRVQSQQEALTARDDGNRALALLQTKLVNQISASSDSLHKLQGRLTDRFPQEKDYVSDFFFNVKKKPAKETGDNSDKTKQ